MQLATHEVQDLHELIMSCVNSVTNMAYMLNHVQCEEFKSILNQHLPLHVRDYNMKVEFLKEADGPQRQLDMLEPKGHLQSYTQSPADQYAPTTPRTIVTEMNDREMATSYLLTLKRAGREYAWSAMEAANPDLRAFLERAFLMSSSHAYDMWQYMVKKGYYPLEQAPLQTVETLASLYGIVNEEASMPQQPLQQ